MFKLVTGLPGDGKTSNELWEFLHGEQYRGRPKYCTPVNGFDAAKHGVTEIPHIDIWESLPEGAAIFCDEVQDFCGTNLGKEPPEWVKQIARHRHSGKDFICTTQSPMFLHPFARKLAKPHVHYSRPWNMKGVRYTWDGVQNDPSTRTAKNLGIRQLVTPNPKVFELYTSTVLDTHKSKPPYKMLAILGIAFAIVIAGGIAVFYRVKHISDAPVAAIPVQMKASTNALADPVTDGLSSVDHSKVVWTEQTIKPRIPGNLFTAPVYDSLTTPTDFPRVAACMSAESRGTCNCYTQQGTPIDVPKSACLVYIKNGAFDPWETGRKQLAGSHTPETAKPNPELSAGSVQKQRGAAYTVVPDSNPHSRAVPVSTAASPKDNRRASL
jgi:zona occludens toxin